MASVRNYTDDEVRAIIDRALRTEQGRDFSHAELLAVASEVGISPEAVELAAREVREGREGELAKQRILSRRRRRLMSHVWVFVIVNAFLFALNFVSTPGQWWFLFPLLGWGLGLVFHLRAALSNEVGSRAIRRERKKISAELRHLEPERPRGPKAVGEARGLDRGVSELSSAVQEKIGVLLSKAAAELRSSSSAPRTRVAGSASHPVRGSAEGAAQSREAPDSEAFDGADDLNPTAARRRTP